MVDDLNPLIRKALSRRKFLAGVGIGAGAIATLNLAGCGSGSTTPRIVP